MPRIFPAAALQESAYTWLPQVRVKSQLIYSTALAGVLAALVAAIFIRVDVSVNVPGIVRPVLEKSELRSLTGATIDSVLVQEGQQVAAGQVLLRLQQDINNSKLDQASYELGKREAYLRDLELLARGSGHLVRSGQYRQQYLGFQASVAEQRSVVDKLKADYTMYNKLYEDKVVAKREWLEKKFAYEQARAAYQVRVAQQNARWQEELERTRLEARQFSSGKQQLLKEKDWLVIKAPVSGTLQQFQGRYAGGSVQAGELLGYISPDSGMIAECHVSPGDIGYLRPGMPVKFQVDAFNYNSWGVLTGTVLSVDNDFSVAGNQPVFKVKCRFDSTRMQLSNGVQGHLKKGMTMQCRFILARRGLLQLLYERADKWLNPNSAATMQ